MDKMDGRRAGTLITVIPDHYGMPHEPRKGHLLPFPSPVA